MGQMESCAGFAGALRKSLAAVAKLVDFLRRGAAGAISAAGVNWAVGALIATAIAAIRHD